MKVLKNDFILHFILVVLKLGNILIHTKILYKFFNNGNKHVIHRSNWEVIKVKYR